MFHCYIGIWLLHHELLHTLLHPEIPNGYYPSNPIQSTDSTMVLNPSEMVFFTSWPGSLTPLGLARTTALPLEEGRGLGEGKTTPPPPR